jgi:hypothetical protein
MRQLRFPLAVAVTSLVLVLGLVVAGGLLAGSVLAGGPWFGGRAGPWVGGYGVGGHAFGPPFEVPAEIRGLLDLPPDERFAHFTGAQVTLTDKDNRPLAVNVTPGTVSSVDNGHLTLAANDGSTRTFAMDDSTITRGKHAAGQGEARPAVSQGDRVIVVTIGDAARAHAVVTADPRGFGPPWHRGPFGPGR